MTLLHAPRATRPHVIGALGGVLREAVRRVAAGAVDTPVLQSMGVPVHAGAAVGRTTTNRPRAHWHTVIGPDGRRHLEADWGVEP